MSGEWCQTRCITCGYYCLEDECFTERDDIFFDKFMENCVNIYNRQYLDSFKNEEYDSVDSVDELINDTFHDGTISNNEYPKIKEEKNKYICKSKRKKFTVLYTLGGTLNVKK